MVNIWLLMVNGLLNFLKWGVPNNGWFLKIRFNWMMTRDILISGTLNPPHGDNQQCDWGVSRTSGCNFFRMGNDHPILEGALFSDENI